ncbi:hypothetical protein WJX72_000648 [[Myrmecia] bisecta]|uniref:Lebercilin domain-containing protein n=1 Tax=[Myrmecia] bisecta TaxID=41462 RepID=A0AAW1Q9U2_9CHLO
MANQKRVAAHKVALDTVQKDRDRLQRLVDIHQIRNDTGLGAAELDRAVSRLMAGGPALSATQKKTLHDLTATIKERNQDYNDLVHKTQQLAREKDADKRRADDRIYSLTEEVKALKAKHKQQAKRIQELEEAAQPVLHGQHAQQLMHNSVAAPAPVLQVPPQIMWNPSPDETDELCKHADESDVKMREAPREETEDADLTQAFAGPQHGAGFLSGPGYLSGLGPAERDPSLRQHHHSMAAAASREKSFLPHGAAGVGAANGGGTFIRHGPDGTGKRVLVLGNTLQEPRGQAAAAPSMRAQMAKKAAGGPMKRGKAGKQKPLSSDSGNILKFFSATGR